MILRFNVFITLVFLSVHPAQAQDLPVEIQADLLLTEAKGHIEEDDWTSAVAAMKKLKGLNTTLPDEFHFHFAKALHKAKDNWAALNEILAYLLKSNETGMYESDAMKLFLAVKNTELPAGTVQFPAGMTKARQAKLLLASIKDNDSPKRHAHTAIDCRQLEALNVELPDDFQLLYSRALVGHKRFVAGKKRLTEFLRVAKRGSAEYKEALQLFVFVGKKEKEMGDLYPRVIEIPSLKLALVPIPAGEFLMGKCREHFYPMHVYDPQHRVRITRPFWLGKFEVTQAQWDAVMGNNPSRRKGANLPVEQVSWEDAMKFCEELTKREQEAGRLPDGYEYTLPTEAQWEFSCRAGTTTQTAFGNSLSSYQANFNGFYPHPQRDGTQGPKLGRPTNVGSYKPNAWRLFDMHGNVREWCLDTKRSYTRRLVDDPVGLSTGLYALRVKRGGAWSDIGGNCLSAHRHSLMGTHGDGETGFRICLSSR